MNSGAADRAVGCCCVVSVGVDEGRIVELGGVCVRKCLVEVSVVAIS